MRDLSDFERAVIVGAKHGGCCISEPAALLGFSCTTVFRVYRGWRDEQKNIKSMAFLWAKTPLLMRGVRGEWPDSLNLTKKQHCANQLSAAVVGRETLEVVLEETGGGSICPVLMSCC